jgi:hypothetical protein
VRDIIAAGCGCAPRCRAAGEYLIGEVKRTNLAAAASDIVRIPWAAALIPPQTFVVVASTVQWHPSLLIEISPHDGPAPSGSASLLISSPSHH